LLDAGSFIIVCLGFAKDGDAQCIAEFKRALCRSPLVLRHTEASGAYDLVLEVAALDAATYYRWFLTITKPFAGLVTREEVSFSDKPLTESVAEDVLWVRDHQGFVGIRQDAIDRLEAEGDYVPLHAAGRTWQIHATLQSYARLLEGRGFVRVHRSTLIRTGAIVRLDRDGAHWDVELADGTRHRVARGRVARVKAALADHSPSFLAASSKA
jgi:DNA-binding LytR/AlgR family response regulator